MTNSNQLPMKIVAEPISKPKPQVAISSYSGSKSLSPTTIDEMYRMASAFASSALVPQVYRGKPDDVFSAMTLGMEIGLPPMRSLQSIAVVKGIPCLYGDAQLALVRASNKLISFGESYDGEEGADNFKAVCKLKREGDDDFTIETFSVADAKKARLWGKDGTWSTHPKRMLRYKARAFALRDKFPDVLLGLTHSIEEMEGEHPVKNITKNNDNKPTIEAITEKMFEEKPEKLFHKSEE